MAGLNQTMTLAQSRVVSMTGARGLGEDVLVGIQALNVRRGFEADVPIVALAAVIDRVTQGYGKR